MGFMPFEDAKTAFRTVRYFGLLLTLSVWIFVGILHWVLGVHQLTWITLGVSLLFTIPHVLRNHISVYFAQFFLLLSINIALLVYALILTRDCHIHLGAFHCLFLSILTFRSERPVASAALVLLSVLVYILPEYVIGDLGLDLPAIAPHARAIAAVADSLTLALVCATAIYYLRINLYARRELMRQQDTIQNLLKTVVHDLNNPLAVITGSIRAHRKKGEEPTAHLIEKIERTTLKMSDLISTVRLLLADFRHVRASFAELDIVEIVSEAFQSFEDQAMDRGIQFKIRCETEDLAIKGARSLLVSAVFGNIISNALKFSADQSLIVCWIRCREDFIIVSIQDRGVGMSKERLEELKSQRKLSTSYSPSGVLGHGFGWTNIFNYVEIHEGEIEIHSSVGSEGVPSGTEVVVKLPRARKSPLMPETL